MGNTGLGVLGVLGGFAAAAILVNAAQASGKAGVVKSGAGKGVSNPGGALLPNVVPQPTTEGIDVSVAQGSIDWAKVKDTNSPTHPGSRVEFAYAKATESLTYVDPKFQQNRQGAISAGMRFGAYHFFHPEHDPIVQADNFSRVVGSLDGLMPPMTDAETLGSKVKVATGEPFCRALVAFQERVRKNLGAPGLLYCGGPFLDDATNVGFPQRPQPSAELVQSIANYQLWLAAYVNWSVLEKFVPTIFHRVGKSWIVTQHSGDVAPPGEKIYRCAGIQTNVDHNYARGTTSTLDALMLSGG